MKNHKLFTISFVFITFTLVIIMGCRKTIEEDKLYSKEAQAPESTFKSLAGSKGFCDPNAQENSGTANLSSKSVFNYKTISNTDYLSAGIGGMRNIGTGQILLTGVSGTVTKAYLYWHGVTNSTTDVGNQIIVNGTNINGTNIGVSDDNCWIYNNSQAYRADVTTLVQTTGNGAYNLSGFGALNPNGASLIVFFNDNNSTNNKDVVIFDGNDSNVFFAGIEGNPNAPEDPVGWNIMLSGINYTSGSAHIQLHVADGQTFNDDALKINTQTLVPVGTIFSGATVPFGSGPYGDGNLWDIKTYDVTSYLSNGPCNLNLTTGSGSDCIALIAAIIDLPVGSAPPPLSCVIEAVSKNATVALINGTATVSAFNVNNGSRASCGIQSITVAPSVFNNSNIGANNVVMTVKDMQGNTATANAVVNVVATSCTISAIPSSNVNTGGVPTNIYLGYGPQSVTLNVNVPAGGGQYSYLWSGGTLNNYQAADPVFTATTAGSFTFFVEVTNQYGSKCNCSITICVTDIRVPGTNGNNQQVYICHAPPGNPGNANTLSVSVNAVTSHLDFHAGDRLGKCDQLPCTTAGN
jgi:hypothetical protein